MLPSKPLPEYLETLFARVYEVSNHEDEES